MADPCPEDELEAVEIELTQVGQLHTFLCKYYAPLALRCCAKYS